MSVPSLRTSYAEPQIYERGGKSFSFSNEERAQFCEESKLASRMHSVFKQGASGPNIVSHNSYTSSLLTI